MEIAGTDQMQFDKKEIAVAADCTEVEVTLKHTGKLPAQAMGHNWVLTKTADMHGGRERRHGRRLRQRSHQEGRHARHRAHQGHRRRPDHVVKFPTSVLKKGEAYSFFCTLPRPLALMKGTFKFG